MPIRAAQQLSRPGTSCDGSADAAMDVEARWTIARRLLHDDALKPEDRLASPLLLRHARWPAVNSRPTVDHVEEARGVVRLRLGDVPVDLPGPDAELPFNKPRSAAAMPLSPGRIHPGSSPAASLDAR
ncbi:hypothetical protein [Streptomyces sp. NPDC051993]|uniref:hypothetical protein n=1 Tax=unclassified Streptomyces TaxID=2593676 RepID=UPI00341B03A2